EGQVEIIGWLYQYYNTVPKDEVMSLPKSVKYRDTQLARATQIFTPDWIVQYMVQNSVGKYWINVLKQRNPDKTESELVQEFNWQYYMIDAQQDEHVVLQLHDVNQSLSEVKIEDVCVIDPAMGSGHILIYIFDLLMDIYESEGYSRSNAAQSIIQNNLYGLDIDTRAFQLGYFAVMMKYRQYNRRAFRKQTPVNVYDIPSSLELESFLPSIKSIFSTTETENIIKLIEVFYAGNDIGSLLNVKDIDLIEIESLMSDPRVQESFELQYVFERLQIMIDVTKVLQQKYDVVVANPPYMGSARMNSVLSTFAKKSFPRSKSDLFSMFIEYWNEMLVPGGYNAMVTMQSWMFLSSFEKMRIHLLNNYTISNLMHMENNVMGIAFGTAVGIFRNMHIPEFNGTYHQIKTADAVGKAPASLPIPGNRFNRTNQANFGHIDGSPLAYWLP
ncbi:BREX-1 system adenine-specific DNA-methyltransferase PglX, partial [Ligilactobacillus equi]|uniref:Eco57I restriction-modification methylase domain-containing protein n=1 Tax=Ligilactobacillus equi TaxID=137357 RepID=UPI002ED687C8